MNISELKAEYKNKLDFIDLEILIAFSLAKTREFVLSHPEYEFTGHQSSVIKKKIDRRIKGEPIAYIIGRKEFYGFDFKVNKHTLIPRPETELMVESALSIINNQLPTDLTIIDVGTGSGCIVISIAKAIKNLASHQLPIINFYGIDISKRALKIAEENAKIHNLDQVINFYHGNLLSPIKNNLKSTDNRQQSLIITANLPYLSDEVFASSMLDVKDYEPKTALWSAERGLNHYKRLFKQIKTINTHYSLITVFVEISPEQKELAETLIQKSFPNSKFKFIKDLAGKWRLGKIEIEQN